MEFSERKRFYNRCLPNEPLEPDDDRNVDFDYLGEKSGLPVRGINWAEKIIGDIALSNKPVCKLFTGQIGAGKTTELKRLATRLSHSEEANLFPVFIDGREYHDLSEPLEIFDIMLVVAHCTGAALSATLADLGMEATQPAFFSELWGWMKTKDTDFSQRDFKVEKPDELVLEMKKRRPLREKVRNALSVSFRRFEREFKHALRYVADQAVEKLNKSGVIVIYDSLEKARGISDTRDTALNAAEKIFAFDSLACDLPVHCIFTVSPALTTRIRDVDFLPMLKIRERDGSWYEPGIYAARELILKRTPEDILEKIFGININTRMDRISTYSGGCPGEMVAMLQMCLAQKKHPMADSAFEHVLYSTCNAYRGFVAPCDVDWLAQIAVKKFLALGDEKKRKRIEYALCNNIVLRYLNDALWYEPHPAILDDPSVQRAIKKIDMD